LNALIRAIGVIRGSLALEFSGGTDARSSISQTADLTADGAEDADTTMNAPASVRDAAHRWRIRAGTDECLRKSRNLLIEEVDSWFPGFGLNSGPANPDGA
jgi:hypothetical protein